MDLSSYIVARWGQPLNPEAAEQVRLRSRHLWDYVRFYSGTAVGEPLVASVHSMRGLPAFIHNDGHYIIVWDAGLGTLLDRFSLMLPGTGPADLADAYVNQVCAVRLAAAGRSTRAEIHAHASAEILRNYPRRELYGRALGHDVRFGLEFEPEAQFGVWLTTELQERFALAHEQLHYLERIDPDRFKTMSEWVINTLKKRFRDLLDSSPLQHRAGLWNEIGDIDLEDILRHRRLNPAAWYLQSWLADESSPQSGDRWVWHSLTLAENLESDLQLLHECVCDVFGALAVCMDAHAEQFGWDATAAAACSRVALESLGTIAEIDSAQRITRQSPGTSAAAIRARGTCLEILLPFLVEHYIGNHSSPDTVAQVALPATPDLREIIRLAGERARDIYSSAVERLPILPDTDEFSLGDAAAKLLVEVGFENVRYGAFRNEPWLFHLGEVVEAPDVLALYKLDCGLIPKFQLLVQRHQRGDWTGIPSEDIEKNRTALWREFEELTPDQLYEHRGTIYSFYVCDGYSVVITTDPGRRRTTVRLL